MELKDWAFGAVTLALVISLAIQFTPGRTFYCEETDMVMECARLSSTKITCYPYLENRTDYKRCSSGWKHIEEFLPKVTGVDVFANNKEWTCKIENDRATSYTKCYSDSIEGYLGELI